MACTLRDTEPRNASPPLLYAATLILLLAPSLARAQDLYDVTVTLDATEAYPVAGTSFTVAATITHVGTLSATYTATIGKTSGNGTFTFPADQTFSLNPGQSVTKTFTVTVPSSGQDARNTSKLKVFVTQEETFGAELEVCVLPTAEVVTTPVSIAGPDTTWLLALQPTDTNFEGRWVKEVAITGSDACHDLYPMGPGCARVDTNTGAEVQVAPGNTVVDVISMGACTNHYVEKNDQFGTSCQYTWPQPLRIRCQGMSKNPVFRDGSYVIGPMALEDGTLNNAAGILGAYSGSQQQITPWMVP